MLGGTWSEGFGEAGSGFERVRVGEGLCKGLGRRWPGVDRRRRRRLCGMGRWGGGSRWGEDDLGPVGQLSRGGWREGCQRGDRARDAAGLEVEAWDGRCRLDMVIDEESEKHIPHALQIGLPSPSLRQSGVVSVPPEERESAGEHERENEGREKELATKKKSGKKRDKRLAICTLYGRRVLGERVRKLGRGGGNAVVDGVEEVVAGKLGNEGHGIRGR